MPIYTLTLHSKQEIAPNTMIFTFHKPEGFKFIPGQYGGFTLLNPPETDAGGITRRFSLLNTPQDDYIAFATRIQSSAYKRVLNNLKLGDEMKFAGPAGNFVLHEDKTVPAVFIAGGIGMTPFYSILKAAAFEKSDRPMSLFYGNQSLEHTILLNDLKQFAKELSNFQLVTSLVDTDSHWDGETGYITHTMLKKYISDLNAPIYYVCGSPSMVTAVQELLVEMGVAEDKIKVEDFPGY
ncbi:MAG: FAD-dependent oxidoreductase [Gammaproteobacteria bacterium]